ncbi:MULTISPECIES: hypothetical protein [unclassified Tenacibaculum]|uniref:hypothetical protein n=1 Tax=unclassified Tenacibaculum TaxID=2635139 RepID=UPI001F213CEF|nr:MULTISPECIES: hypothetical protein [unclassified Tenacibaculum]MCF2875431.1 hypothetical protein [Tenacibaculum sp. Cn5-1]MCF2935507.1 hypothetical protein [Tenacibaculum sp. Cn5-34]MCG7512067.1 hypothetical protein [Tenacibaculum sp. Cn5-46]
MNLLQEMFDMLGIKLGLLLTGAVSGIIGAKAEDKKGFFNYLFRAFGGATTTTYLTPFLVDILNLSENSSYGVGFLIGLISMNLVQLLLKLSSNTEFVKKLIFRER